MRWEGSREEKTGSIRDSPAPVLGPKVDLQTPNNLAAILVFLKYSGSLKGCKINK
jgi:hypothetical protein